MEFASVFVPQQSRDRQVFRSAAAVVLWWGWLVVAVAGLVAIAAGGHGHASAVAAAVLVAVTGLVYGCALCPRIVADEQGISVLNPVRVHLVPWPAVAKVDLVNAVRVHCVAVPGVAHGKIIYSWAVQSSGRSTLRGTSRARRAAAQAPRRRPAGYGSLPPAAREVLSQSSAEFVARQLDERASRERASTPSAQAAEVQAADVAAAGRPAGAAGRQVTWAWTQIAAMVLPVLALIVVVLT
jgi:hypothetical protein